MSEKEILMLIRAILRNAQMSETLKNLNPEYRVLSEKEYSDIFNDSCELVDVIFKVTTIVDGYVTMKREQERLSTKRH